MENQDFVLKFYFILYPLLFLICSFAFFFFWAKLSYRFWKYEITEDAVRIERGVIWKKYISIPYERIQNVDIYRGVLARILGLSTLNIQTAGYSGAGRHGGIASEGNIPGISVDIAEQLRDDLIKRAKSTRQGL
jgi:membrane protein YdbS with pleckstrin-like domain